MQRTPDREKWLAAADRVGALARECAEASEREKRLLPAVDAALRREGLYAAFLPESLGGTGVDPVTLLELVERVASYDASAGWCVGTCGLIGGFAATRLPDEGAAEVFGDDGTVMAAGGYVPRCAARHVSEGFRVSGRMPFASGSAHADAFVVTGLVAGDQGMGAVRSFVLPPEDVVLASTWDVAGLEATSSHDLVLDDVLVPAARTFAPLVDGPRRGGSAWRASVLAFASIPHLGFALGAARLALDEIKRHADRQRLGSAAPLADRPVFRRDFGRAHVRSNGARLAAYEAFEEVMAVDGEAALEQKAALSGAIAHAYANATRCAEFAFRAGGATALYRSHPLQRIFRDVQAGAQHIVAADEAFERAGAVFLGVDEPGFL